MRIIRDNSAIINRLHLQRRSYIFKQLRVFDKELRNKVLFRLEVNETFDLAFVTRRIDNYYLNQRFNLLSLTFNI